MTRELLFAKKTIKQTAIVQRSRPTKADSLLPWQWRMTSLQQLNRSALVMKADARCDERNCVRSS